MRIPKALRRAIVKKLKTETTPLSSSDIAERVNNEVNAQNQKTPKQMAFVLKQLVREGTLIVASSVKNGINAHGNERTRDEYTLNFESEDPDIVGGEEE